MRLPATKFVLYNPRTVVLPARDAVNDYRVFSHTPCASIFAAEARLGTVIRFDEGNGRAPLVVGARPIQRGAARLALKGRVDHCGFEYAMAALRIRGSAAIRSIW